MFGKEGLNLEEIEEKIDIDENGKVIIKKEKQKKKNRK